MSLYSGRTVRKTTSCKTKTDKFMGKVRDEDFNYLSVVPSPSLLTINTATKLCDSYFYLNLIENFHLLIIVLVPELLS